MRKMEGRVTACKDKLVWGMVGVSTSVVSNIFPECRFYKYPINNPGYLILGGSQLYT